MNTIERCTIIFLLLVLNFIIYLVFSLEKDISHLEESYYDLEADVARIERFIAERQ